MPAASAGSRWPSRLARHRRSRHHIPWSRARYDCQYVLSSSFPCAPKLNALLRLECLYARLGTAEDERVHVVGPFVGVYRLQVHDVADDMILIGNSIATMHIAGNPCNIQSFAAIVALEQ